MEENITRQLLIEIQDHLAPRLDSYEQMLYHYLFRHTHLEGRASALVGIRTIQARAGMGIGQTGSLPSQQTIAEKLRSLERKGCIEILSRSSQGTEVRVFLPKEINGVVPESHAEAPPPLESLDFFNTPELRLAILQREGKKCFYCLRSITEQNYTVDHVRAQANGGAHGYMNVVACCFECNSRKQHKDSKTFILQNYRNGLLTVEEHAERLEMLERVTSGLSKPNITKIV